LALTDTPIGRESNDREVTQRTAEASSTENQIVKIGGHLMMKGEDGDRFVYGVSNPTLGNVDITINFPQVVIKGVTINSDTMSSSNVLPQGTRFVLQIDRSIHTKMANYDTVTQEELNTIKADQVPSLDTEIDELTAPDPVSTTGKIFNAFNGNQATFEESYQAVRKNCAVNPPTTLTKYIDYLKKKKPTTINLIPPASQIKKNRHGKNIYDGPVVSCTKKGFILKTDNGAGLRAEGNTTTLSGTVIRDKNADIYPQQITGIPSEPFPMDDFLPKGTIITPQTKRYPKFLTFLQALLPIYRAVDLSIKLAPLIKRKF